MYKLSLSVVAFFAFVSAQAGNECAANLINADSHEIISDVKADADIIETSWEIVLSNLKTTYVSSISGTNSLQLAVTDSYNTTSTLNFICKKFGASRMTGASKVKPEAKQTILTAYAYDNSTALEYYWQDAEYVIVDQIVCAK